jgi:2-oxoglutarate ferredoxin oxidoreductase subunit beta
MAEDKKYSAKDYRSDRKPIWCAGCGDFAVLSSLTSAFAELEIPKENIGLIAGIGCSSRMPMFTDVYGFHTIHGRALCVATGLAVSRPDVTVVTVGGDGDGFSIGGNHFMQSCRRNVNVTYIVMDNSIYGMTKGQASPTTEEDWTGSSLTPEGTKMPPFEPLRMALSAGATFVARGFSGKPKHLKELIKEGIKHQGFSFIQVLSPCVTWRPDHNDLKKRVHEEFGGGVTDDEKVARKNLLEDDKMTIGILYQKKGMKSYHQDFPENPITIDDIEKQFEL